MKLFALEITYKAYVWAERESHAEDFVSEIVNTEDYSDIDIQETNTNVLGWNGNCCVYHAGSGDLLLKDVLVAPAQNEDTTDG
jgi:hypothetical protein